MVGILETKYLQNPNMKHLSDSLDDFAFKLLGTPPFANAL